MTNVIKSYKTHGKMELQAVVKPNSGHYIFQWNEGGEVPQEISGVYTSLVFMDVAVASYLGRNIPKPEIDERVKAKAKTEKRLAKNKLKEEVNGKESRSSL